MAQSRRLPRVRAPRYARDHWRDVEPTPWVSRAVAGILDEPVALPLTRLSGSLVYPVLERAQLDDASKGDALEIALVSVSPPARALRDLLQLRAYGHALVLLPPTHRVRFFDLAELDLRGIGVAAARGDGSVEQLIAAGGIPENMVMEPWWRSAREHQLLHLART